MCSNGKYEAEACKSCNGGKGVKVIDSIFLRESLCDKSSFVFFDGAISLAFNSKTHLLPTMFLLAGQGTVVQVLAFLSVAISRSMASCQSDQSDRDCAWLRVLGSS